VKIQKSYDDKIAALYLVPTPIGNFLDMTYRAVEVLNNVDHIFCEDTRVTKVLLSHFQINTPLSNYHIFNEDVQAEEIVNLLDLGKKIALVSDAGMPAISDPGFYVANLAIEKGHKVISLPGANAALTALIASGIPCEKFFFNGFLPSKSNKRIKQLNTLVDIKETLIFYEAPHRIIETLHDMLEIMGNREIAIARELTKKYEEYLRGNIEDILKNVVSLKGEIVIIMKGNPQSSLLQKLLALPIEEHYKYYIEEGMDDKSAMKQVASDRNIPKNEVYSVVKK